MIIGLSRDGFTPVRRALQAALPEAEFIDLSASEPGAGVDVLVPLGATVDAALMDATRPRLIQQFGTGVEGVDLPAARARGIPVAHVPSAGSGNDVAVAEIAILHILALLRRYRQGQDSVAERQLGDPSGSTLFGKTVAVIGVGAIGGALIARLSAFGAVPIGVGRREGSAYPAAALLGAEEYYRVAELTTALARCHIVVVCCPLTEHTRGLIGREQLAAMAPGGYLVNVARGPIVDYAALLEALRSGQLAGAGIDVAWDEPIDPHDELLEENVTITPHIGGVTTESYAAIAQSFAANVHRLGTSEPLAHRVDS